MLCWYKGQTYLFFANTENYHTFYKCLTTPSHPQMLCHKDPWLRLLYNTIKISIYQDRSRLLQIWIPPRCDISVKCVGSQNVYASLYIWLKHYAQAYIINYKCLVCSFGYLWSFFTLPFSTVFWYTLITSLIWYTLNPKPSFGTPSLLALSCYRAHHAFTMKVVIENK